MPQYLQTTQNLILRFKNLALNQFDIFGQLPNFRVMNKAKYNSIAGLLTTIIIGSMTLIYLTNELISMITQAEPSVVSSEIQVFETQKFALENDNFTLAVSVTNSAGNSIIGNGIYYNLTISHCVRSRIRDEINGSISVKVNCTLLPIETCNMSHFTTDKQYDYFNRMRLGAMQCINRKYLQQNPPHLQGQLNAITFQYLEIHLRTCQNHTEYQQCATLEEQQQILMSGHYAVYTSDYLMQLDNPQQPYQQIINSEFSGFSVSSSKIIKQYYRIIETTSDDGLLLQNIQTQTNLKQQEWRESTELYNGNYIIDHYIALDYRQTDYSRTYIKIQTVLSRLGGIWQIFIIIVATIIRPLINNLMNLEIANQLFRFKFDNNICLTNMDSEPQKFEDKINMPLITQLPNDLKSQLQIIFGIKNNHKKLFNQAKDIIMEHLDMITIIKKFQQIDILKQILLTNEQQHLIEIIPKPLIQLQKQQEITNNIQFINHINQSCNIQNSYVDSYQKMIQSKNIIDERLINLLDKQLLNMFEKSIGMPNISKTPGIESKFEDINEPIPLLPK